MYPARYPEVIAVAAIDSFGEVADFSNLGTEVDLLAPGNNVVSTNLGGGFGVCSGTSMAVPHVTAAVVMMKALNPTLTYPEVKSILKDTALNGELNLIGALEMVKATM
jgi:subtilisin family serine protease